MRNALPIIHLLKKGQAKLPTSALALALAVPAGLVVAAANPADASANSTCWGASHMHSYYLRHNGRADTDLHLYVYQAAHGIVAKVQYEGGGTAKWLRVEVDKKSGPSWYTKQDSVKRSHASWAGCARGTGFGEYKVIGTARDGGTTWKKIVYLNR